MQTMMQIKASMQTKLTKRVAAVTTAAISSLALILTGCGTGLAGSNAAGGSGSVPLAKGIHGVIHGGQNPVGFSTVQLYQVAAGSSATAAIALGSSTTSDVNGNFSLTGLYTCNPNGMVYVVATGGNPGLAGGNTVNNTAISMMTGLGSCATLLANAATTFININELTTVATAYSLAGYMTSYANAGYKSTYPNGLTGLTSAFATQNLLVNTSSGYTVPTVAGSGIATPSTLINSLANLISSCVNTSSSTSAACAAIFAAAQPTGGTAPADIIGAVLDIAHNPTVNLSSVYTTYAPTFAPFAPSLASAPADWSMPIIYSGNGLSVPYSVALDASGNAWIANEGGNSVTEISNGVFTSGATGYASTSIVGPQSIAIDNTGNVWLANTGANNLLELNPSTGAVAATITAGISGPVSLAIDTNNKVWVSNFDSSTIAAFSGGAAVAGSPFTNTSLSGPTGIAIDGSNNVLVSNSIVGGIAAFTNAGVFTSTYTDGLSIAPGGIAVDIASTKKIYTASTGISAIDSYSSSFVASPAPISGSGLNTPLAVAVDDSGNVFTVNGATGSTLSGFSSTGVSLFSTTGIGSLNLPVSAAIDGSGNLWTTDAGDNTTTEFVGLSTPTITPVVANLIFF
jgi:streptogramin lyase